MIPERGTCQGCGAEVIWCLTAANRRMPVDAEPCADGNLMIDDRGVARPACRFRDGGAALLA